MADQPMDLLSDPVPVSVQAATSTALVPAKSPERERGGKGGGLRIGGRKAAPVGTTERGLVVPQQKIVTTAHETRKKLVSYSLLATTLKDLAGSSDQKKRQRLVTLVFPKLAVYNSVDPSLAPALLQLLKDSTDATVLRYVYYFVGRMLRESGLSGSHNEGGGVPTPVWDAMTDGSVGLSRAEAVPPLLQRLIAEARTTETFVHPRRVAALKTLTCAPLNDSATYEALVGIIISILDVVTEGKKKRRRWRELLGRGSQHKDSALRTSLFYSAMSSLRRIPLDDTSDALIERVILGIGCPDAVGVRHALAMAAELACTNPIAVATYMARIAGGSIAHAIRSSDMLARVYLARLCGALIHAPELYDRSDQRGLYSAIVFQLLYDTSTRVALEAIACIVGRYSSKDPNTDQRADGWQILTTSVMDTRGAAREVGRVAKTKEEMPQPPKYDSVLKVVAHRLDYALRSTSRPMLHSALEVVQDIGKARAAALGMGLFTEAPETAEDEALDFQAATGRAAPREKVTIDALLGSVMEGVRCVLACECVYVRAQVLKAMIWMHSQFEPVDELKSSLLGELSDPEWPAPLLNDLLVTMHARFKATPEMAVVILDLALLFVTHVPSKVDTSSLQALWKTCLVGCGPEGKHLALEAVSQMLEQPPPPPAPPTALSSSSSRADKETNAAVAQQHIVQAAIWFLGENANFAAGEYAWESATPPGSALMLLDAERMVAAAGVRNPTLASAMQRLQRCATSGAWEHRVVAISALMTIALRSGEPYRLQIYEFFHALFYGGGSSRKVRGMALGLSNGEDRGASGSGLAGVIGPLLRVLDEMYLAQEAMMRDIRMHDFSKEEWKEEELEQLYSNHEALIDMALLFCFVPRDRYLPLGPISSRLINQFRIRKGLNRDAGRNDAALKDSLHKLLSHSARSQAVPRDASDFPPITLLEPVAEFPPAGPMFTADTSLWDSMTTPSAPATPRSAVAVGASAFDQAYAASLLEADEDSQSELSDGSASPPSGPMGFNVGKWDEAVVSSETGASSNQENNEEDEEAAYEAEMKRRSEIASGQARQKGKSVYAFTASDEDELSLQVGDEIEIEYEADGWYYAHKVNPTSNSRSSGFVPVLYVETR